MDKTFTINTLFFASIEKIGINPYVLLPEEVLTDLFAQAGKEKGPIPVRGSVNGKAYRQTLVKFRGRWRLYINTLMLKDSPRRIGEQIELSVEYDPEPREIEAHPKLLQALKNNEEAAALFNGLRPSLQREIIRYIASLKTEASIEKNVQRAMDFLLGKTSFAGRKNP